MNPLLAVWEVHCNAQWPTHISQHEGELMTIDTVVAGCVVFSLETKEGLDQQRIEMIKGCLADLNELLPELSDESHEYFHRLQTLGRLLLESRPIQ